MLKIRDDVDLKELEKFEFEQNNHFMSDARKEGVIALKLWGLEKQVDGLKKENIYLKKENTDLRENLTGSMMNAYNQGCKYTENKYQDVIKEAIDYIKEHITETEYKYVYSRQVNVVETLELNNEELLELLQILERNDK